MTRALTALAALFLVASFKPDSAPRATLEGEIRWSGVASGPVVVQAYALAEGEGGRVRRISKADVLGGARPARTTTLTGPGRYRFEGLSAGAYGVVAFMDLNGNGNLDFDPPEPLGWYAAETGSWIDPVTVADAGAARADLTLRTPTPFPKEERRTEHGALRRMKGLTVLQLHGTARERGFAHGFLVGPQIKDFLEFYVLEDSWQSAARYEATFVPFMRTHFALDPEYLAEVDAVVEGMKASGMDMRVEWLGRDFRREDLLAINAYVERRATQAVAPAASAARPAPAPEAAFAAGPEGPACTQFAFWGEATQGSELAGGLIAGRNMDGEVDLRKVTVSHFLLYAVAPSEPGRKRWVSAMWPGFVGTLTGINEEGLYSMEDAGSTGPGPVVDGLTPCSWVQRHVLETAGAESTPESVGRAIDAFRSKGGGTFGAGSIILWAVPFEGQQAPAFVSEGDRFGGAIRTPGEVAPSDSHVIMASNHYLKYGVDARRPGLVLGAEPGFSSLWRYEAGRNALEAWLRQKKPLGTEEMRRLLQTVAHGTTEHSVIFRANEMTLDVAVDDLATDLWDAPYQPWVTFSFAELFAGMG